MPALSRFLLRLSLIALLFGAGLGAWRLAHPLTPGLNLRGAHIEVMLFGWLVQFVVGTAYWMLPRAALQPERGNPGVAWAGASLFVIGLSGGVVFRLIGSPELPQYLASGIRSLGIFVLVLLLWPRIKPFRNAEL